MQTIYRPGQWYVIVMPGALVALPPDVPGDVVARLWERMPESKTLATVVDVLTARAGGDFSSLPPFVAAVVEGTDIRIALRGGVSARVSSRTESYDFSGAEVTTWSERFVGGASRVEVTVEAVESEAALPVQSGVVRAAAVSAELEPGDDRPLADVLGPVPVIEIEEAGASAAALTGTPGPSIANFGTAATSAASVESASDDIPTSAPVDAEPLVADVPPAPGEAEGEAEAEVESVIEPTVEPVADDVDEQIVDDAVEEAAVEATPEPEAAEAVDGATIVPTEVTLAPSTEDFDQLWGATVHSVPTAGAASAAPAVPGAAQGDHDGATISAAELRAMRQQAPTGDDVPTAVIPVATGAIGATGRIRVSTGQVVALDRTVIIGRRPRSTRASGANLPHLIAVESPQQDISRSHLEIRPEGDTVVVIDLHTTNGSTLLRPGADPIRLHPGEQTLVLSGDVVDLGDGVKVAFEDLP